MYHIGSNTIHLSEKKSWYKTRRPRLQLDILACLVLRGKLSKGEVESLLKGRQHANIINSFKRLEEYNWVKKSGQKFGRGKKQDYYRVTQQGLELLIGDEPDPIKFWKALLGYRHHTNQRLSAGNINSIYNTFLEKYLRYRNHSFSFQLDIFDNMLYKLLDPIMLTTEKLNLEQKIVEILAIYPIITLEELIEKTRASRSDISKCLATFTLESYAPLNDENAYIHQGVIGKKHNKKYWDFLLHSIIIAKQGAENGTKTYELSLFGVMVVLTLIRCSERGELKHDLYYNEIRFPEYYDKIASNYAHKLPLIFKKWDFLKGILGSYSAYNFDIIIDKDVRLNDSNKVSIISGGSKELKDSIREIVLHTRKQLNVFASAGVVSWLQYIGGPKPIYQVPKDDSGHYLMKNDICKQNGPDMQKIDVVKKKLGEILLLLNPIEEGFSKSSTLRPEFTMEILYELEEMLEDE